MVATSQYGRVPWSAANASARSRTGSQAATNSDSGKLLKRRRVDLTDLATANQRGSHGVHEHQYPGKYLAPIARRKASDRAISSMPFIPSSMLTQPS